MAQRLNTSQVEQSSSAYDGYGVESSSGSPTDPFGYNAQWGYYLDRETGLYACMFRYYDPGQGRWLNRDPLGYAGGVNVYGYCGGGPVGYADSSGLSILGSFGVMPPQYGIDPNQIADDAQGIVDNPGDYNAKNNQLEKGKGGRIRNKNTDCGLFVGTSVGENDPSFPGRGTGLQRSYLESEEGQRKWQRVPNENYTPQPGDIYNRRSGHSNGFGHTELSGPNGSSLGASYGGSTPRDTGKRGPFPGAAIYRPRLGSADLISPRHAPRPPSLQDLIGGGRL